MDEEKQLTQHESLLIIQQMIQTAKKEQKDDGKGWILWGWMLFIVSILSALSERYNWIEPYFFWNAFGIITSVFFVYAIIKYLFFSKKEIVKTYTQDLFNKLNIGFFISLMFIIVAINVGVNPNKGFALLINLYSFWILIYGTALNFKPSIIGAFISWAFGIACLLFGKNFEEVMLLHGGAVLSGYIIPGHIAYNEFKKLHRKQSA